MRDKISHISIFRSADKGIKMLSIKKAKKLIKADPTSDISKILAKLVLSLESDVSFQVKELYDLDYEEFELPLDILREWRIDQYFMSKAKIFDAAFHAQALHPILSQ